MSPWVRSLSVLAVCGLSACTAEKSDTSGAPDGLLDQGKLGPFPNADLIVDGHVALPEGLPAAVTPWDVSRVAWRTGFSPVQVSVAKLWDIAEIDPATLPAQAELGIGGTVRIVDLTDGSEIPCFAERDAFPLGWVTDAGSWVPPDASLPVADYTQTVALPAEQQDPAAGVYVNYTMGFGGLAARYADGASFWASRDFGPQAWMPTAVYDRWVELHLREPAGLDYGQALPRAPYADLSQAVLRTWHPDHWYR